MAVKLVYTGTSGDNDLDARLGPIAGPVFNVADPKYGAKGDGVADDTAKIQAVHDAIVATGKPATLLLPPLTYKITGAGLTINASFVSVSAVGAVLNGSTMSTGAVMTITGTASTPYRQVTQSAVGFRIVGPGKASSVIGVKFNTTGGGGIGPAHFGLRYVTVEACGIGYQFGSNAYTHDNYNCEAFNCGVCVEAPSGITNGGERLAFHGGTFFNSDLAVRALNSNGMLIFVSCSFDYNTKQFEINNSRVLCLGSHLEAADHAAAPVTVAGSGGTLHWVGGWILLTGATPRSVPHLIDCSTTSRGGGGVLIDGAFLGDCRTSSGRLATGTGEVRLRNIRAFNTSQHAFLISDAMSRLADGGFEEATVQDDIFITSDTVAITSRTTGTNITLANVSGVARTGAQSLRMRKVGGVGTACAFRIVAPVTPGAIAQLEMYHRGLVGVTGSVFIEHGYVTLDRNASGVPTVRRSQIDGGAEVALAGTDTGWVKYASGDPVKRAPGWATHFFVRFNANGMSAGDFHLDDVVITVVDS